MAPFVLPLLFPLGRLTVPRSDSGNRNTIPGPREDNPICGSGGGQTERSETFPEDQNRLASVRGHLTVPLSSDIGPVLRQFGTRLSHYMESRYFGAGHRSIASGGQTATGPPFHYLAFYYNDANATWLTQSMSL